MEDTIHHKQLRQQLLNNIKAKGMHNTAVLEAMNKVPRHLFLGGHLPPSETYTDHPMNIGCGQTISQPFTVAYQTSLLNLVPGEKVLEIGTGSGYQAAVLFEAGANVYTIERQKKLFLCAQQILMSLGYSGIHTFFGDGTKGLSHYAPFDKILVTAAAPVIPFPLIQQLKIGGIMVVPVDEEEAQKMFRVTRISDEDIEVEEFERFKFVPLLDGVEDQEI